MRWPVRLRMFLRALFRRRAVEAELEEELRDHLAQETENNLRSGLPAEEAKLAAQRLTGSVSLYKEECRDSRASAFVDARMRDFRHALRALGHSPLFTAAAIVTLALGIGANTTVFTFVENILLRPLPVRDAQQLVALNWGQSVNLSYPDYVDFRDRNSVFSDLVGYRFNPINISVHARENFRLWGYEATGNYFETLGIKPELGRFFGPDEDKTPGANPVIVLSYRCWQSQFAADRRIIGRTIKVNGYPFTVIGIAPQFFSGTELIVSGEFWVPTSMELEVEPGNDWLHSRIAGNLWTMGRLKPGVSRAQAEGDLDRIAQELGRSYPDQARKSKFHLSPPGLIGNGLREPITNFAVAFTVVAGVGLLLACVNLAGMLLARASDRHREIGIRLALGASKRQVIGQLMTESLLLALIGGALGVGLAFGACGLFSSWRPEFDLPVRTMLRPDVAVLGFAFAAAILTTVLFGLTPALQAVRIDLVPSLKDQPVSQRFRLISMRDFIVAGQVALSIVLLISSALVVRSLQHALTMNLGFNPNGAVSVSFDLRLHGYDSQKSQRFVDTLLRNTSALPGVESAGIINNLPLRMGEDGEETSRADRPMPKLSESHWATIYNISPGYLHTAETRLLAGRDVNGHDRAGEPPVMIVNEALVQGLFGNENPLGKRIRIGPNPKGEAVEIVGVVETGKYDSLGEDPHPAVFLPIAQSGMGTIWTTVVARSPLPAQEVTELLRKAVLDLDPELTLFNTGSLKEQLALPLFPARMAAIVLGVFGALAMVLAATGLFALMSYSVARRRREIGIRMALGARWSQVLRSVLMRVFVLCAVGIVVGTVATFAAGHLLSAVLYDVSPRDPVAYSSALLLMTAVALLAAWNPAARAIRTDPARTLREE